MVELSQETTAVVTGFEQSVEICKPVFPAELENRDKDKVVAPVVQTLDSAIHRISHYPIHWIDFYPVDSAIQRLNNRGLEVLFFT